MITASAFAETDGNVWWKLAEACAQGAVYDSNERAPHSKCLPHTRESLLRDLYSLADDKKRKIVWIVGESGSGKSSVAYSFADHLHRTGNLAGTFFFSRKYAKR
ncbi:hypothetical protein CONPUDRAFT_57767, partial [Coniophora puteana RWD-64-598 SS2]